MSGGNIAVRGDRPGTNDSPRNGIRSWVWLAVVVAFLVQIAVWSVWFVIAKRHPVQEVPLATHSRG